MVVYCGWISGCLVLFLVLCVVLIPVCVCFSFRRQQLLPLNHSRRWPRPWMMHLDHPPTVVLVVVHDDSRSGPFRFGHGWLCSLLSLFLSLLSLFDVIACGDSKNVHLKTNAPTAILLPTAMETLDSRCPRNGRTVYLPLGTV
uniref:Uncharacterized protein n=1 Tax=Anopheles darlingi TaxID=43151 RepID=A0A2M4DJ64_ANODA